MESRHRTDGATKKRAPAGSSSVPGPALDPELERRLSAATAEAFNGWQREETLRRALPAVSQATADAVAAEVHRQWTEALPAIAQRISQRIAQRLFDEGYRHGYEAGLEEGRSRRQLTRIVRDPQTGRILGTEQFEIPKQEENK